MYIFKPRNGVVVNTMDSRLEGRTFEISVMEKKNQIMQYRLFIGSRKMMQRRTDARVYQVYFAEVVLQRLSLSIRSTYSSLSR